jgi:arylsulfatase A-like enzyme
MRSLKKTFVLSLVIASYLTKCTESKKPNILLILADDVGMGDIGDVYWDVYTEKVAMNNIAELASKGVIFTDMHSTPLCAPSRYAFLTGNYAHRGRRAPGTWNIAKKGNRNQLLPEQEGIAQVLRDRSHDGKMAHWSNNPKNQ